MRLAAVLSLLVVLTTATAVQAQTPSAATNSATNDAKETFRRGEAAYSAGNYEVAISEWNEAYKRDPRPRIQFNLSQAYERLGQLPAAEAALVKFLEKGDPDDPTYSDANARLVALRQRLASTGVVVKGGQEGGNILIDNVDWGRTPRPDRMAVTPGSHTLIVRWPGQADFRTDVFVPAGQVVEVSLPTATTPATVATTPVATSKPAAEPDPIAAADRRSKRPLFFGIGAGLAAAGVGMIVYGVVRGNAEPSSCSGAFATFYCNPKDVDTANHQSIAGYAVGGVLLAGSAAMFVVGALTGKHNDAQAKAPVCGFGLTSASCRMKF